jgi:predicted Zn-dependent protease
MKIRPLSLAALAACLLFPVLLFGQEDLARESGLPSRIGGSRCEWAPRGARATLQGTFNVSGMQNTEKPPNFSVALYAGGAFVSRQRIKNGGTFFFYCVPDQSVFVVAEVNSIEVMSFSVNGLAPPPQTNYQDVFITWSAAREAVTQRNEVISARNSYERTKDNQKRFDKAMAKVRENNGATTAEMLEELIARDPNDYVALSELGMIYCENKKYAEAEPLFEKALALKGDFISAMFGAGRAALALKKISRAIDILTQANKIMSDSADVNHFLGEAYLQNKQGTLAIEYMRKAITLAPFEKADLHLRIAWLYNAAGARELAAAEYKLFLEKRPNYPDRAKMEEYIAANSK